MHGIPETLLQQARRPGAPGVQGMAKLMTLLENDPRVYLEFLQKTGVATGPRFILGITGAPGSGKSTLTDALLTEYRKRSPEMRLGVIAVDPSSPFSGGAVLADRVRMMQHAVDPLIFIRSLASRGHLGGLALGVKSILGVMAWAGIDLVIIETVGVGQNEIDIVRIADEVAVVLAPGNGDAMQLLKAGLMEIGDFIVINKADRPGAEELHAEVLAALQLEEKNPPRPVALVSAVERKGIPGFIDHVEERITATSARRADDRKTRYAQNIRQFLLEIATTCLATTLDTDPALQSALKEITEGRNSNWDTTIQTLLRTAAEQKSGQGS